MNVLVGSSKDILHFSPEVLEEIFSMLAPKDLISLAQTCTLFHKIINQSDQLWANVCFNQFKIRVSRANGFARRLYKNVLHRYGHLLGFWTLKLEGLPFGGGHLLQLKYSDGQLCGLIIEASNEPNDPAGHLISKPIFKISMDKEDDRCVNKYSQECCIKKDPHLQSDLDLEYIYKKLPAHWMAGSEPSWYLVIHSRPMCVPARHYSRLQLPTTGPSSAVPIQPGFFTLTTALIPSYPYMNDVYAYPTKTIVMLTYENSQIARGLQIAGDNPGYIEAEQANFRADLHCCSCADQEVHWDKDLPRQPSLIPEAYREKFLYLPNDCLARVRMTSVRGSEVRSNELIYWIVFNEDVFGIRRIADLPGVDCFEIYHRVKDPLFSFH